MDKLYNEYEALTELGSKISQEIWASAGDIIRKYPNVSLIELENVMMIEVSLCCCEARLERRYKHMKEIKKNN